MCDAEILWPVAVMCDLILTDRIYLRCNKNSVDAQVAGLIYCSTSTILITRCRSNFQQALIQ